MSLFLPTSKLECQEMNITEATDIYAFGCFKKWFIVDISFDL
jgi:hypothetical protein